LPRRISARRESAIDSFALTGVGFGEGVREFII